MAEEIKTLEENKTSKVMDLLPSKSLLAASGCTASSIIQIVLFSDIRRVWSYAETTRLRALIQRNIYTVAKMTSVSRSLAAVAQGWDLHQMDVNIAFLHRDLHEEVYMSMPLGLPLVVLTRSTNEKTALWASTSSPIGVC